MIYVCTDMEPGKAILYFPLKHILKMVLVVDSCPTRFIHLVFAFSADILEKVLYQAWEIFSQFRFLPARLIFALFKGTVQRNFCLLFFH